jgi:Fe-S oxidoreductase
VLKHEYPDLGGKFTVIHHTEFLWQLISSGKLKFSGQYRRRVVYHDSCYLGRFNDIYYEPRRLLRSLDKLKLMEMRRSFDISFCCGCGGGNMWAEVEEHQKINAVRLGQALEVRPEVIATACPYCLTMFDDALRVKEMLDKLPVYDVAEILLECVQQKS